MNLFFKTRRKIIANKNQVLHKRNHMRKKEHNRKINRKGWYKREKDRERGFNRVLGRQEEIERTSGVDKALYNNLKSNTSTVEEIDFVENEYIEERHFGKKGFTKDPAKEEVYYTEIDNKEWKSNKLGVNNGIYRYPSWEEEFDIKIDGDTLKKTKEENKREIEKVSSTEGVNGININFFEGISHQNNKQKTSTDNTIYDQKEKNTIKENKNGNFIHKETFTPHPSSKQEDITGVSLTQQWTSPTPFVHGNSVWPKFPDSFAENMMSDLNQGGGVTTSFHPEEPVTDPSPQPTEDMSIMDFYLNNWDLFRRVLGPSVVTTPSATSPKHTEESSTMKPLLRLKDETKKNLANKLSLTTKVSPTLMPLQSVFSSTVYPFSGDIGEQEVNIATSKAFVKANNNANYGMQRESIEGDPTIQESKEDLINLKATKSQSLTFTPKYPVQESEVSSKFQITTKHPISGKGTTQTPEITPKPPTSSPRVDFLAEDHSIGLNQSTIKIRIENNNTNSNMLEGQDQHTGETPAIIFVIKDGIHNKTTLAQIEEAIYNVIGLKNSLVNDIKKEKGQAIIERENVTDLKPRAFLQTNEFEDENQDFTLSWENITDIKPQAFFQTNKLGENDHEFKTALNHQVIEQPIEMEKNQPQNAHNKKQVLFERIMGYTSYLYNHNKNKEAAKKRLSYKPFINAYLGIPG